MTKFQLLKKKNIETQMIEAFKEGYSELENGDVYLLQKNLMRLNFCILNLIGLQKQH